MQKGCDDSSRANRQAPLLPAVQGQVAQAGWASGQGGGMLENLKMGRWERPLKMASKMVRCMAGQRGKRGLPKRPATGALWRVLGESADSLGVGVWTEALLPTSGEQGCLALPGAGSLPIAGGAQLAMVRSMAISCAMRMACSRVPSRPSFSSVTTYSGMSLST